MPKRPCPFEDDLPPQMKVHVGQKEVDHGVCSEERMKEVYDKTLGMLKEGMKSFSKRFDASTDLDTQLPPVKLCTSPTKSKSERRLKQTVLNSKLGLVLSNNSTKVDQPSYDLCWCSRVMEMSAANKCGYCDQLLCTSCLQECANCSDSFCQSCTLPLYDQEDRIVCLNCYKHK